jgi:hypothetical protein
MKNKFTFKKEQKETGLRSVDNPYPNTTIKHNRKRVGTIYAPNWTTKDNKWTIGLMADKGDGTWEWAFIKFRFDSEVKAREFLVSKAAVILGNLKLFYLDD